MALQDRIVRKETDVGDISGIVYYSAFYLWAVGDVTGADVVARFGLAPDEVTQSQNIKAVYDALATDGEKARWLQKMEAAFVSYENLVIDKSQLVTILGL